MRTIIFAIPLCLATSSVALAKSPKVTCSVKYYENKDEKVVTESGHCEISDAAMTSSGKNQIVLNFAHDLVFTADLKQECDADGSCVDSYRLITTIRSGAAASESRVNAPFYGHVLILEDGQHRTAALCDSEQ